MCRAGLEYHPEYVSARVTLGRALLASNALDDAFNELSGVLQTAPENLAALRGLGETHQRRGDLPAALGVFRRALALAPHDAELAALVTAIQPSVPGGNGDSRKWPPPSGSHPIAKPSQQQKTGPHQVVRMTPPTGRHPVVKPGPIGLPVNEIEGSGDTRTAALDLLGAPPSDAEREHAGLDSETPHASSELHAVNTPGSTLQQERDLHELLASLPMADDQITPDAREMLASWSVEPVETLPAPAEPPAPVDPPPPVTPPARPMILDVVPGPVVDVAEPSEPAVAMTSEPTHALTPDWTSELTSELILTPPEPFAASKEVDSIAETPDTMEPSASPEGVLPFPSRSLTTAATLEPELNPIEAAQVALLERWLESIKAARAQDHNPAK